MFSIVDTINRFWDWIGTLSFSSIANIYWFLFFIEVPRYYLLEYLVIFNRLMTRNKRYKEKELARFYLYRKTRSSASWCRVRTKARISIRW